MSRQSPPATERYGPASLIGAIASMAIVETATWVWLPYWMFNLMALFVVSIPVLMIGMFLSQMPETNGQLGRGILVGYLATLLTLAIMLAVAAVAGLRSMWFS